MLSFHSMLSMRNRKVQKALADLSDEHCDDWLVKRDAVHDLCKSQLAPEEYIPLVLKVFYEHSKFKLREDILKVLPCISQTDSRVLNAIYDALQDKNTHVRSVAAQIIGDMGVASLPSLDVLRKMAQDKSEDISTRI